MSRRTPRSSSCFFVSPVQTKILGFRIKSAPIKEMALNGFSLIRECCTMLLFIQLIYIFFTSLWAIATAEWRRVQPYCTPSGLLVRFCHLPEFSGGCYRLDIELCTFCRLGRKVHIHPAEVHTSKHLKPKPYHYL